MRDSVFHQISEVLTTHQVRLFAARGTRVSLSLQELLGDLQEDIYANNHDTSQNEISASKLRLGIRREPLSLRDP